MHKLILLSFMLLHMLQSDSSTFIEPDSALTLRLNGSETSLAYESNGDDVITITVRAVDDLDPVLEILTPDLHRLAYNDDHHTTTDGLKATDSVIERIKLPDAGVYTIRINSFNGVSEGEVEVTLETVDAPEITGTDTVTLAAGSVYTFTVPAGVTVTARDPQGVLDPILTVFDESGAVITRNDDHASADLSLNIFDSRLELPQTGETYTVQLTEFKGRGGVIEIKLHR